MKICIRFGVLVLLLFRASSPADYHVSELYTGSSVRQNTAALNSTIATKLRPNDRLIFNNRSKGIDYIFGSILIVGKDSLDIIIEADVTIQGSDNANRKTGDYDSTAEHSLLYIKESRVISISGGGTIDGNSSDSTWLVHQRRPPANPGQWWDCSPYVYKVEYESRAPANCIYIKDCSRSAGAKTIGAGNIRIEGITIDRAYQDAIWLRRCNSVTIANVKIHNCFTNKYGATSYYMGGDGIDIDLSKNVTITNADITSSDDAICIKSLHQRGADPASYPSDSITVSGCTVRTPTNGLKIGTETCDDISNVKFSDCTVDAPPNGTGPFGGVAIMATDGSHIRNVEVKNIRIRNAKAPIFVKVGDRMKFQAQNATSGLSNISFEGIYAEIDTPYSSIASSITGFSNGKVSVPVRNVTLKDINFVVRGNVSTKKQFIPEADVPEAHDGYPQSDMFQYRYAKNHAAAKLDLQCYGIFFRNVRGLTMENVSISTRVNEKDIRPRFIYKDVEFASSEPRDSSKAQ